MRGGTQSWQYIYRRTGPDTGRVTVESVCSYDVHFLSGTHAEVRAAAGNHPECLDVDGSWRIEAPEDPEIETPTDPEVVQEQEVVTEAVAVVAAATVSSVTSNIGSRFSGARMGSGAIGSGAPTVTGDAVMFRIAGQSIPLGSAASSAESASSLVMADTGFLGWSDLPSGFDRESQVWSPSTSGLLGSSACQIALNAADEDDGPQAMSALPRWTLWGQGDFQSFASDAVDDSSSDGGLKGGYVGIDARIDDRWLTGLAASRISVAADYGLAGSDADDDGHLDLELTGIHPYLRFAHDAKTELWVIFGMARAEIENVRQGVSTPDKSDLTMRMAAGGGRRAAGGGRRALQPLGGMGWALFGDVGPSQVDGEDSTEAVQSIQGLSVSSSRLRFGVEGSYTPSLGGPNSLTSFAEVALRIDRGDGGNGVGVELSPGLSYSAPGAGIGVDVRGRVLVLSSEQDYEEYGASVTASLSPRPGGLGLSMSVWPRWGTDAGAAMLWHEHFVNLPSGAGAAAGREGLSLNTRVSYGIAASSGVLAPFGEIDLKEQGSRRMRMGARFNRSSADWGALGLELSGERYEDALGGLDHRIGVNGRLSF